VAGVCMGAAYLAEAGLLEGRIATTHWPWPTSSFNVGRPSVGGPICS